MGGLDEGGDGVVLMMEVRRMMLVWPLGADWVEDLVIVVGEGGGAGLVEETETVSRPMVVAGLMMEVAGLGGRETEGGPS